MYLRGLFLLSRIRNDHASPGPFVVSLNHPCKDFRMLIRNVMLLAAILIEVVELPLSLDSRTDYLPAVAGNQRTFIEVLEAKIVVAYPCTVFEERNKALSFHRNNLVSLVNFRVLGLCEVHTGSHDIHYVAVLIVESADALPVHSLRPMGDHRGADATLVRLGLPIAERRIGNICPAGSEGCICGLRTRKHLLVLRINHLKAGPGHVRAVIVAMVRMGRYKLVYDMLGNGELYDLEKDPSELRNLYGSRKYGKIKESLLEELLKWEIATEDPIPVPRNRYRFKRFEHNYLFTE